MYDMYTITASLPDLQCLLWTFAAEMKKMDVIVILKGTNGIRILEDDRLGLHRSVLRTLCHLLEYCYEKEFKQVGDKITLGHTTSPILKNSDGIKKMFNTWNEYKWMPSLY
jgi:hypothetical protein